MRKLLSLLKRFKVILIILILLALGLFVWQRFFKKSTTDKQTQTITVKVGKGNVVSSISASGQVENANYLSVTTSVNGIVKKVYVKEGDIVKSGQKLMDVTLDSEGERSKSSSYASYIKARDSLKQAQQSISILEAALYEQEVAFNKVKETNSYQTRDQRLAYKTAEANYTQAKNNLENKKTDINQLQLAVNNAWLDYAAQSPTITAPADGVIASVLAVEGVKIENSVSERSVQTVAAIKKEGTPIASLNIGELDINNVKVGQKVNLTLSSLAEQTLTGIVAGIDKVGASTSGVTNYPVTVKFDNSSDQVLPNMSVQAEIVIEEKQGVLYVSSAAIQTIRGKSMVRVLRNGTQQRVEVQTGIVGTNVTEIMSGLAEGEEIVIDTLPTQGFTTSQNQSGGGIGAFGGAGGFVRRN